MQATLHQSFEKQEGNQATAHVQSVAEDEQLHLPLAASSTGCSASWICKSWEIDHEIAIVAF